MRKKEYIRRIAKKLLECLPSPMNRRIKNKIIASQKKINGHYRFSIITSVYNVESYLDDYFVSIINQTLDFKKHLELIIVDDGSLDNSAEIIKKWQLKYPNNIFYIKKANGGLASGRNLGLQYVQTDWVSFIDPDDTVNLRYFESIDAFLYRYKETNFSMVSCNMILHYEETDEYEDKHPLKYRFRNKETILDSKDLKQHIQLSASSAIFRYKNILDCGLLFSDTIKVGFEDGLFVNQYLLRSETSKVAFLAIPKYYYRKRLDNSSMDSTRWSKEENFDNVLRLGCLDLINEAKELYSFVPYYLQRTILYYLMWYFKYSINKPESLDFLTDAQQAKYKSLLDQIFREIEIKTIIDFNGFPGFWFYHKVGLIGSYKNNELPIQIIYIEAYDPVKSMLKLHFFSYGNDIAAIKLDEEYILPSYFKIRKHDFLGELFVKENIIWMKIDDTKEKLYGEIGNKKTLLSLGWKLHNKGLALKSIIDHFSPRPLDDSKFPFFIRVKRVLAQTTLVSNCYKNSWLLIDRDIQADDNAEHLYRYIAKNHPEINIFFILDKNAHDWNRLKFEGFNLIAFGSIAHQFALMHASNLVSSHADPYVTDFLPKKYYKDFLKFRYTFLQHGVTKDDLSKWLNTKNIDCLVTAAKSEYNSIVGDSNRYRFTSKEVVLTGFPRHDALLSGENNKQKIILIMPTWRMSLVGKIKGFGSEHEKKQNFYDSDYAKSWKKLLNSPELLKLASSHSYKIIFAPHINIHPYLKGWNISPIIDVFLYQHRTIQELFQISELIITDYSSVAFEMGLLRRGVIYYQFDHDIFFNGKHVYQKGYFNYERDGFGPVCYDEKRVLYELKMMIQNEDKVSPKYLKRMKNFFTFHDTNNSKRTFEAIKNLDIIANHKVMGYHQYTVISAVYNVGLYLEDYFISLINQTLDFKQNIKLIMVDDGSMDNSAEIIKKWQKRYPYNITYLKKENGGQSSARNVGLQHLETEWVTFIDPDDFLDLQYFEEVEKFLIKNNNKDITIATCNPIFYFENEKIYKDTSSMKYRFEHGDQLVENSKLGNNLLFSTSSAFLQRKIIEKYKLRFNELVKPTFEDAYFIWEYLFSLEKSFFLGFLSKAKYFYRKRADGLSTVDTQWRNVLNYDEQLKYGYLGILKKAVKRKGLVPVELQRTVLCDLMWYYKRIINKPQTVEFLTSTQIERFQSLLYEIFQLIDVETIINFNLAGCWFYHKVGLIGLYKKERLPFQIVYVRDYKHSENIINLRYFTYSNEEEILFIDGKIVQPIRKEKIEHIFCDELFVFEKHIYLAIKAPEKLLDIKIGNKITRLSLNGKQHHHGLLIENIRSLYTE